MLTAEQNDKWVKLPTLEAGAFKIIEQCNTMEIIISQLSITFLDAMKLYPDGSVEFLNGASPNDAAIAFLKAVNLMAPNFLRTEND